ncbi:unnamed protein product [Diabrotica balteata]|uniref:Uncharacterized protein n=1 Tax=Diabrotica balteata TaxID=107213 RepID=A0A9N9XC72_DIABA|nr:unnamed protein product [Diabrotica balteata]
MYLNNFKILLLVGIVMLIAVSPSSTTDYSMCPETSHQRSLIYHNTLTGEFIYVRIPGSGFFNASINCLQIIDMNESFSTSVIEEGGYGKGYVGLRIDPVQPEEQVQYDVQIYVDQ